MRKVIIYQIQISTNGRFRYFLYRIQSALERPNSGPENIKTLVQVRIVNAFIVIQWRLQGLEFLGLIPDSTLCQYSIVESGINMGYPNPWYWWSTHSAYPISLFKTYRYVMTMGGLQGAIKNTVQFNYSKNNTALPNIADSAFRKQKGYRSETSTKKFLIHQNWKLYSHGNCLNEKVR